MSEEEKIEESIGAEEVGEDEAILSEQVEDQDGDTEEIAEEQAPEDYVERKLWEAAERNK